METLKLIKIRIQGKGGVYPNCKKSKLLRELMGKNGRGEYKTFMPDDLEILTKLGYSYFVEVKDKEPAELTKN